MAKSLFRKKITALVFVCLTLILCAALLVGCAPEKPARPETPADSCTVTLMVDGVKYDEIIVERGGFISELPKPHKDADDKYEYAFSGWFKEPEFWNAFSTTERVTDNITLYAKFAQNDIVTTGGMALYALIGFLVVVAVLALLVAVFTLSGKIFRTKAMSKENLFEIKKKDKKQPQSAFEAAGVGAAMPVDDQDEIVAAITAAISVVMANEYGDEPPEFVIRRVTRK